MRGDDNQQEGIFSYISPEKRVPAEHPLRPIRKMVDEILKEMSPNFQKLYSDVGRPSIAPERLFRSLLLQIFYSVRSERMLIEQLQYNLLFRWFVGMEMDEVVWNHAVYSKNRERLLNEEIAASFFARVLERARPFMSDEHFTVDGTLVEAWASHKSFRPKDGTGKPPGLGGDVDFRGEKRKNQTHESTTDPDARLWTKSRGSEAKLSYMGHVMMENRNGLSLLSAVARIAREEGSYGIRWEVLDWNESAIKFYRSLGCEFFDEWRQVLLQADALNRLADG